MHFLALGSIGDVQPLLLSALAYAREKKECVDFVTHINFKEWIEEKFGAAETSVRFHPINTSVDAILSKPDIAEAIANGQTLKFISAVNKEGDLLLKQGRDAMEGCKEAKLLICNQTAIHIAAFVAEKTQCKVALLALIPSHPSIDIAPVLLCSKSWSFGWVNKTSGKFTNWAVWIGTKSKINGLRKELGLGNWSYDAFLKAQFDIPCFYAFSSVVVKKPSDWPPNVLIGGFILDNDVMHKLSNVLEEFLSKGKPPVYFGFGSMPVSKTSRFKKLLLYLLKECPEERFVVFVGSSTPTEVSVAPPIDVDKSVKSRVCFISSASHSLLFPRCKCIIHHAGAGTTAATLLSGTPSIPCFVFGDQPFWANRLVSIGVSPLCFSFPTVSAKNLAKAIIQCENESFKAKAKEISLAMSNENGITSCLEWLHKLS